MTRLILLVVALGAIAGMGYGLWVLNRRHADITQYEDELTEEWDDETTVLAVPETDLVGTISDNDPYTDAGFVAAEMDLPGAGEDAAGAQVVLGVDARGSGAADVAVAVRVRLTPAQRRRALHKGRIPRNLPDLAVQSGPGRSAQVSRQAGEPDDLTGLAGNDPVQAGPSPTPGRVGEVHHERHERIPQPLEVWDPLMRDWMPVFPTLLESARHEAHLRQWEHELGPEIDRAWDDWADGFGRLEQTDWTGAAA